METKKSLSAANKINGVNLNTATEEMLANVPNIGTAKAAAIIAYRENNGGFKSFEELLRIKGVGKRKLDIIKLYLTL